jgi:hypothetical protein
LVVEKTDLLRPVAEEPIESKPLPRKRGKHGVVKCEDAGHEKGGKEEKKIDDDEGFEAPSVCFGTG